MTKFKSSKKSIKKKKKPLKGKKKIEKKTSNSQQFIALSKVRKKKEVDVRVDLLLNQHRSEKKETKGRNWLTLIIVILIVGIVVIISWMFANSNIGNKKNNSEKQSTSSSTKMIDWSDFEQKVQNTKVESDSTSKETDVLNSENEVDKIIDTVDTEENGSETLSYDSSGLTEVKDAISTIKGNLVDLDKEIIVRPEDFEF